VWTVRPIWHRNQPVESIQILRWNVFRFHFRVRLLGDRNSYMYYGGIIVASQINWQIAEFKPGKRKIGSLARSIHGLVKRGDEISATVLQIDNNKCRLGWQVPVNDSLNWGDVSLKNDPSCRAQQSWKPFPTVWQPSRRLVERQIRRTARATTGCNQHSTVLKFRHVLLEYDTRCYFNVRS